MSDILGPLAYDKQGGGQFLGNGNNPRRSVSDATAQAIDKEVRDLVDDAHETALNILRNNLPLLESISQKINVLGVCHCPYTNKLRIRWNIYLIKNFINKTF